VEKRVPLVTSDRNVQGSYLPPGTPVRYDGLEECVPEYGIVIHCWLNEESVAYDCYVAFFGDRQPTGKPPDVPYVLRYFSASLEVIGAGRADCV
jgi:hypothetical protein